MYQLHNVIFILFSFILFSSFYGQKNTPKLSGPYLGQKPPGMTSELFAPGILSTEANEFNATFTLSIDAVYFTGRGKDGQDIMVIKYKEGIWQNRKLASFSSPFRDVDPFITPDGKKLFFSSNRPIEGDEAEEDCDFWYVVKLPSDKWSEAKHLDNPSTKGKNDFYYVSTKDGDVYFSIFNDDGTGDLYYILSTSKDQASIKFNYPINTKYNEHDPFVPPDGSYLIFSSNRPDGYGSNDLYISFRNKEGTWNAPVNMGEDINSEDYDYCPILSPDGKYLFFSSSRSGNGDVYWVDVKILDEFKLSLE